jgi:ATPase subunit of ABC transporter with duplicated ATPase domains
MNTTLRLVALGFAYAGLPSVFEDIHAHLVPGWTGLVGANGAGKSTLLALLMGQLVPTTGQLLRDPVDARIVCCPQRVEEIDPMIQGFAWCWDADAMRLRSVLGLDPDALERWSTLSPGERKRWQVGAALADEPEVLLLDEPTNHLDATSRDRLEAALRMFRGVGVIVSHDRALLDRLTSQIWWLAHGALDVYAGGYTAAHDQRAHDHAHAVSERDALRAARKATERRLQSARERRQSAEGQISHGARMRDANDHDARTLSAKTRAQWAEAGAGRQVEVTRRELDRARGAERDAFVREEIGAAITIQAERCPRPVLVSLEDEILRAGDAVLSPGVTLHVGRAMRLWLSGDNGAGKSTLVRLLLERCTLDPARVLYVPQELEQAEEAALLTEIMAEPPERLGRIMQVAAALGLEPELAMRDAALSPGMARKLMIARGLVDAVWLLVLDEPTNHLDAPSIDRLEAALRAYTGALVLVSHDEALAAACATERMHLERGLSSRPQDYATEEV